MQVLFEPIDNISLASAADHRRRLTWLDLLWRPARSTDGNWVHWTAALEAASVFGQLSTIRASLQRCDRSRSVAFGLKARLTRLLSDEPSMHALGRLMRAADVRVVSLHRSNRIKQVWHAPWPEREILMWAPCTHPLFHTTATLET